MVRDTHGRNSVSGPDSAFKFPFFPASGQDIRIIPGFSEPMVRTLHFSRWRQLGSGDEAKDHLNTIRRVSQIVNGTTGKVLHEIVTDGSIYFGDNAQNGDVNETAEFATAVATLWRWSGDNSVRDDNYEFIKDGLNYITTKLDTPV